MLLWLAELLKEYVSGFAVIQYLTLRAILSTLTALAISLLLGPAMIRMLTVKQMGQPIREDGPKSHFSKAGTPTMGGGMIILVLVVSCLLWADLSNKYIWVVMGVTVAFGLIGWLDDYLKLSKQNSAGLPGRWKYLMQTVAGLATAMFLFSAATVPEETTLIIPFVKDVAIPMGIAFVPFVYFMIVGTSNAVNLTDGLDGLAILPSVLLAGALAIFAYLTGHVVFAGYLFIPYIPGAGELVIFCGALAGAGLGFLWFNTYPAQVFMGDIGALSIGAALGTIAVIVRQELVFLIMAGVFVMETASVIIQVASFKLTGKRVFRMAPIHHHFELKGWPEPRVIVRFWIISLVLILIGLASLKIR